ncbi:hypothetical protein BD779DRAFT_1561905 [Infundibulicybe gibba]|nr:hypothetical protein BD779DRAFT_1561905 [Infundibulicybe gibba]
MVCRLMPCNSCDYLIGAHPPPWPPFSTAPLDTSGLAKIGALNTAPHSEPWR